jgi:hypothetical protein
MNTHEIRKGNLVFDDTGKVCRVKEIHSAAIVIKGEFKGSIDYHLPNEKATAITLTEEYLIKFGFEKKIGWDDLEYWQLQRLTIMVYNSGFTYDDTDLTITSVHQLQNLFYSLTGEELTIKE